jgi:hypothetical protein
MGDLITHFLEDGSEMGTDKTASSGDQDLLAHREYGFKRGAEFSSPPFFEGLCPSLRTERPSEKL